MAAPSYMSGTGVAYRKDGPRVGHALQFVAGAVGERDPGPEHQRWDRARYEYLASRRERHDAPGIDQHHCAVAH